MANTKNQDRFNNVKEDLANLIKSIEEIKISAEKQEPNIKEKVEELSGSLENIRKAADTVIPKNEGWDWLNHFIRRMLSREVIIAVVAIVSIWTGGLEAEQAIGVAVAGAGLVLGRSAVKVRQKTNEN